MCFASWCRTLGTTERTVWKHIRQIPDMRYQQPGMLPMPRQRTQADLVDYFFVEMYQSAAEPLPIVAESIGCRRADSVGQPIDTCIDLDNMDPWLQEVYAEQEAASTQAAEEHWDPDGPPSERPPWQSRPVSAPW